MLKIRISGVETRIIHARWKGGGGVPISYLLDLDDKIVKMLGPDDLHEAAFQILLELLLVCSDSQEPAGLLLFQRYLPNNTELLDQVMMLARCFQLEELAENIATVLLEQEEERIANSQCLKCGVDHRNFCLISRELCDDCCWRESSPSEIPCRSDSGTNPTSSCWEAALDNFLSVHQEEMFSQVSIPGMEYGHGLGELSAV